MKNRKKILAILATGLILVALAIHFLGPYMIIQPMRRTVDVELPDIGLEGERLEVITADGISLAGYRIVSKLDSTVGGIILVHGIGSCKEDMLSLAGMLAGEGMECYVFDLRAHGESGGEYCTYGYFEKHDIKAIRSMIAESRPELRVGIWGNSLGGAVALQALALDDRLDYGLIESTFTDMRSVVHAYQKRYAGIALPWITDYTLDRAANIAGFDPDSVRPAESARHITVPMLIAHGDADERISFSNGQQIFDNLASGDKELVVVEGGHHVDLFAVGGKAFEERLLGFLGRVGR